MLYMYQRPVEYTRTANHSCYWQAECEIAGQTISAQARLDEPYALARMLVDAGITDQLVVVISQGTKGATNFASLHRMAHRTIEESQTVPVRSRAFRPPTWDVLAKTGEERTPAPQSRLAAE